MPTDAYKRRATVYLFWVTCPHCLVVDFYREIPTAVLINGHLKFEQEPVAYCECTCRSCNGRFQIGSRTEVYVKAVNK